MERQTESGARQTFDAYLARLGVERADPSIDELFRLHQAQVERIPYETTWIFLGDERGVDQLASVELIAQEGRGGYCFHLNGAFAALLEHLGYDVTLHLGGVHGPRPDAHDLSNHLVLIVENLPTDANPDGVWYVDAGLGDALHEPLPLIAGTYRQGPDEFTLMTVDDGIGDWRLVPDAGVGIDAMSFVRASTTMEAFAERHQWLASADESKFRKIVTVQRRDLHGATVLRGRVVTTRSATGIEHTVIRGRDEWFELLSETFELPLHEIGAASIEQLWAHVESVGLPEHLAGDAE